MRSRNVLFLSGLPVALRAHLVHGMLHSQRLGSEAPCQTVEEWIRSPVTRFARFGGYWRRCSSSPSSSAVSRQAARDLAQQERRPRAIAKRLRRAPRFGQAHGLI